mgnify:CR=1 FL=1
MPHEACFDSFEAEMLEPCGLSAIWVLSTFSKPIITYKKARHINGLGLFSFVLKQTSQLILIQRRCVDRDVPVAPERVREVSLNNMVLTLPTTVGRRRERSDQSFKVAVFATPIWERSDRS